MFKAYDTAAFGKYMRSVRKSLNLTQMEVEERSSVNIETLRRLEQGKVVPKYETIEYLSRVYKHDLLLVFSLHRTSQIMYDFYGKLDEVILDNDLDKIESLDHEFKLVAEGQEMANIIDKDQIRQFKILLEGMRAYVNRDFEGALDLFLTSMKISNKAFTLGNYKKQKFDLLESRIMMLIALSKSYMNEISLSIDMMLLVLKQINSAKFLTENHIKLIIKLKFNISYDYYSKNNLTKSLQYAKKGIEFCKSHQSSYSLFALYYRSGAAKLMMGRKNYRDDFRYCMTLLEMDGRKDLMKTYRKRTLEKHNIKI